jgi:polar amino acid transport system substrate-binding protein
MRRAVERFKGWTALVLVIGLLPVACGVPRDPEKTLEKVTGGVMRVGITGSDPWTALEGPEPTGVEVELVERFAESLDARIDWVEGSEAEIFEALEVREIDLAIGGFTSQNSWAGKVTFTHPYITTPAVVGWPRGEEIPTDIAGHEVAVEKGSHLAAILEKTDARPVEVVDLATVDGPAAVDNWLLDDLDLEDTGIRLDESDHVMAVPNGENAWLVRLERFLLTREAEIADLLAQEGDL